MAIIWWQRFHGNSEVYVARACIHSLTGVLFKQESDRKTPLKRSTSSCSVAAFHSESNWLSVRSLDHCLTSTVDDAYTFGWTVIAVNHASWLPFAKVSAEQKWKCVQLWPSSGHERCSLINAAHSFKEICIFSIFWVLVAYYLWIEKDPKVWFSSDVVDELFVLFRFFFFFRICIDRVTALMSLWSFILVHTTIDFSNILPLLRVTFVSAYWHRLLADSRNATLTRIWPTLCAICKVTASC